MSANQNMDGGVSDASIEEYEKCEWVDGDCQIRFAFPYDQKRILHCGWSTYVDNSRRLKQKENCRVLKKKCNGSFECPVENCEYTLRPVRVGSKKTEVGIRKKKGIQCPFHSIDCQRISCNCSIEYEFHEKEAIVTHVGRHCHRKPPHFKPGVQEAKRFEEIIRTASSVPPKGLVIGDAFRPSVSQIHPSFQHLGRVQYYRRKILQKQKVSTDLSEIITWHNGLSQGFIKEICLESSASNCIVLCTDFMMEFITSEFQHCPMQTDTIFNTVAIADLEAILCTTSAFSKTLKRYIPLFATVMLGQTSAHFEKHFDFLFKLLALPNTADGPTSFGGMTCDFSTAELNGFKASFEKAFVDVDYNIYFNTCEVHFKRSLKRVQISNLLIPPEKKSLFYTSTMHLFEIEDLEEFEEAINDWKEQFPNVHNWLDWYLAPCRRSSIFKVFLSGDRASEISKNTNAQEGIGGDIKRQMRGPLPSNLGSCLQSLYLYFENIENDFKAVQAGNDIRYHKEKKKNRKRKKKTYENDGRAPDTVDALSAAFGEKQQKRKRGRPKKTENNNWKGNHKPSTDSTASKDSRSLEKKVSTKPEKIDIAEVNRVVLNNESSRSLQVIDVSNDDNSLPNFLLRGFSLVSVIQEFERIPLMNAVGKIPEPISETALTTVSRFSFEEDLWKFKVGDLPASLQFLTDRPLLHALLPKSFLQTHSKMKSTELLEVTVSGVKYFVNDLIVKESLKLYNVVRDVEWFKMASSWFFNLKLNDSIIPAHLRDDIPLTKISELAAQFLHTYVPVGRVKIALDSVDDFNVLYEFNLLEFFQDEWIADTAIEVMLKFAVGSSAGLAVPANIFRTIDDKKCGLNELNDLIVERAEWINRLIIERKFYIEEEVEFLYIPLNLETIHWALALVDMRKQEIITYESLRSFDTSHENAKALLVALMEQVRPGKWHVPNPKGPDIKFPEQPRGTGSCGFYVATFVEMFVNFRITAQKDLWGRKNIPFLRMRWLATLLQNAVPPREKSSVVQGSDPIDLQIEAVFTCKCKSMCTKKGCKCLESGKICTYQCKCKCKFENLNIPLLNLTVNEIKCSTAPQRPTTRSVTAASASAHLVEVDDDSTIW